MKTALHFFLILHKQLRKIRRIEDFQQLLENQIQNTRDEAQFKRAMGDFFISENLYYHLRKLFISIESAKSGNRLKPEERRKQMSTLLVKDRAFIFGVNGVVSLSDDLLSNLQPSYFLKGGMGRKSKFASMFNLRKRQSAKSTRDFRFSVPCEEKIELIEVAFSLDNFLREDNLAQFRIQRTKNEFQSFSLRNLFLFKKQSSLSIFEEELSENDLFSARSLILDSRAKQSRFQYETPESMPVNFPMEVGVNKFAKEDLPFMTFFFEVSNSEMLEKMEHFLVNYLTLSKTQRESFKTSTLRRRSLQSVLAILKRSETHPSNEFLGDSQRRETGIIRTRSRACHKQNMRDNLLKSLIRRERHRDQFGRVLHGSHEPRNRASNLRLSR